MRSRVQEPSAGWLRLALAMLLLFGAVVGASGARAQSLPDFTELVEKVGPAVVNIRTLERSRQASAGSGEVDPNVEEFFRRFGIPLPGRPDSRRGPRGDDEPQQRGVGSGFILSADGYVMTNAHVVDGADEVIVTLTDKRELKARIVGTDRRTDVAVVKVEATGLPFVKIGDSDKLKVGEWVVAIGSPFGLENTVTAGIVSAKGRSLPSENYVPFIQTDVAINPGNSGGPLFNLDGEVVGVNSQIYSRTGGFMGLSFAIPIDVAMNVADQLRNKGKVSRGWLGVLIQDVTRELADSFGMPQPKGALVAKVLPGGPAEAAGIHTGDVILQFNGREVNNSSELPPMVGAAKVKEGASVLILRKGERLTLSVNIGELPGEEQQTETAQGKPKSKGERLLSLAVADLDEAQKKELDLKGGVLVKDVASGPAQEAGIRRGDVIQMLNNTQVNSVAELRNLVKNLPSGRTVAVLVQRQNGPLFLAMRTP